MRLKKLAALFLSSVLMLSLLGGCGDNGNGASGSDKNSGSANAGNSNAGDSNGGGSVAAADPASKEYYEATLMYWAAGTPRDLTAVEEAFNKLTMEQLNMKVNLKPIDLGTYFQTIQMTLSSDEPLDVFPMFSSNAVQYITSEFVVDMAPYLQTCGKDILDIVGEADVSCCNIKDFQYGVPNMHERVNPTGFIVRTDLFEETGFTVDDVKTMADMTKVFEKVYEKHPDIIMYNTPAGQTVPAALVVDELAAGKMGVLMNDGQDTTVVNYYESEEFRNMVQIMREWFQAGYLNKDLATMSDQGEQLMRAGQSFSFSAYVKPNTKAEKDSQTGYDTTILPVTPSVCYSGVTNALAYAISANSKNPERAMDLLNWVYKTKEANDLLNWGIEGRDYVVKEDGTIGFPDGVDVENVLYHQDFGWAQINQFNSYVWEGNDPDVWEQYQKARDEAMVSKAYGFVFDPSDVLNEVSAINDVINTEVNTVVSGTVDPETAIKGLNDKLYAVGLQTVIDEKQRQLDEWLSKQ